MVAQLGYLGYVCCYILLAWPFHAFSVPAAWSGRVGQTFCRDQRFFDWGKPGLFWSSIFPSPRALSYSIRFDQRCFWTDMDSANLKSSQQETRQPAPVHTICQKATHFFAFSFLPLSL